MKKLNENELEKIEALNYLIKYLITNPEVKDYEIWNGIKKMEELGIRLNNGEIDVQEIDKIIPLEDAKELVEKFFIMLEKRLEKILDQDCDS